MESAGKDGGGEQISKSKSLADKEGLAQEVLFQNTDNLKGRSLGGINGLLVVCSSTDQRTEPATEVGEDLRVGERHPLQDLSIVLLGLSEKSGLLVLGGNYACL